MGPKDAAWEAYFANPEGYWDNRTKKLNPKAPDFKNKTTNEVRPRNVTLDMVHVPMQAPV